MYSICIDSELFQTFLLCHVHFEICDRRPISSNIDQFHERWGEKRSCSGSRNNSVCLHSVLFSASVTSERQP